MELVGVMWRRWLNSPARDAVFAVLVAVVLVYGSYGEGHPQSPSDRIQFAGRPIPHPAAGALALVAIACLALAWRRRWPVAVLAVSTAAVAGYSLLGYINGAALLAPVLALYAVATQVSIRRALVYAAVTALVLLTVTGAKNPFGHATAGGFDLIPFLVAAAFFAGIAVANRRAYVASIHARAQEDARRRIDEERLRIARELHDVVAHTMATINVQAGAAAHVLGTKPEAAAEALQAIKAASKDGLRELRAILNVLRQADDTDPTQPAPGIAQLSTLIDGARRAGLETALTVTGEPFQLPAAADLAAYRIVQESLTNVIRHAGPATATVTLAYGLGELRVEVADTGRGKPAGAMGDGTGHGLAGMAERAAAVGGTVEAGPGPAGGFRVAARLPLAGGAGGGTDARGHGPASGQAGPAGKPAPADGTGNGAVMGGAGDAAPAPDSAAAGTGEGCPA
jgi:signal transduction histidine kinase